MENGVWIRSGKACGQGTDFGKRHEQHHKAALDPKTNAFYLRNPARDCVESKYSPQLKKCDFEDLRQFIGLGFDRHDVAAVQSICGDEMFDWKQGVLEEIRKRSSSSSPALKDKKLQMVLFLFELVYDLMLSSAGNISKSISESPGFESAGLRANWVTPRSAGRFPMHLLGSSSFG